MKVEDLRDRLRYFYEHKNQIGISVYCVEKDSYAVKKLDIADQASPGLMELFFSGIDRYVFEDDDLSVIPLSGADERKNAIFEYDIKVPEKLKSLEVVTKKDNLERFDFNKDNLNDVFALLIEIGNENRQLVLYKTMAPVNIFSRKQFFLRMKKARNRFEKIDEEFIRVSPNFQLMRIGEDLLVFELQAIEKHFGVHEVIKKEAAQGVQAIEDAGYLGNPEVLHELIGDVKFSRKLTRVAKSSPVLEKGLSSEDLIAFCKNFPVLAGRIRFNENEDKILLDTKKSKDLFIHLLMDDYLTSELTRFYYKSVAKDGIQG
jgi:hypothetical protein